MILVTLVLIVTFIFAVNDYMVSDFAGRFELAVTFAFIGVSSLFWLCLSIRCPRCGKRPVWGMLRTVDVSTWLVKLHAIERCPECGLST
jgi:hypothetical protein